jgi:uncharacterized membrane protein YadS
LKIMLFSFCYGAYCGIIYDSAYLGGTRDNVNKTSVLVSFLRIIVVFILAFPFSLPYLTWHPESLTIKCAVKYFFPFLILGFLMFSCFKSVLNSCGLIRKNFQM